jgi:hypothetical protein
MVACHLLAFLKNDVIHLQFRNYPIILGKDLAGGQPQDIPELITQFFGFDAGLLSIVLVGVQVDAACLARIKKTTLSDALMAINSVMPRTFSCWTAALVPDVELICLC